MRLQDILQIIEPGDEAITVRKLDDNIDFRPLLKEIEKSGETHVIVDCQISNILELFRQANEVKMMEEYLVRKENIVLQKILTLISIYFHQNYFITTIDAHIIDFAELKFVRNDCILLHFSRKVNYNSQVRANISTVRFVDPTSFEATTAVQDWNQNSFRNKDSVVYLAEHIQVRDFLKFVSIPLKNPSTF